MKNLFLTLSLLFCLQASAQFPAPTSFTYNYDYIQLGESNYCSGKLVNGPNYCSHFAWTAPDTTMVPSNLVSYSIYYQPNGSSSSAPIAVVMAPNTSYNAVMSIMGTVWVVANYVNPAGTSVASNMQANNSLPLSIVETQTESKNNIVYNRNLQELIISDIESPFTINVIDTKGNLVKNAFNKANLNLSELANSLYIVEIIKDNSAVASLKIVK